MCARGQLTLQTESRKVQINWAMPTKFKAVFVNRNITLDNTKFLMVFLVVFGHLIQSLIDDSAIIKTVFMSIYSFHMPVLIVISGMLAKPKFTKELFSKAITSLLVPYLAFTLLYELFSIIVHGKLSNYTMRFEPYWILWFIFSLFFWRMPLPFVLRFRYPVMVSIIVSLIAGYIDFVGYFLGISRTLYFFPFFIIGYKISVAALEDRRLTNIPKTVYLGLLACNIGIFWWLSEMPHHWLYGSYSYGKLNSGHQYAAAIRLGFYCISITMVVSILMLAPRTKSKITQYGANVIYVYLWHGFFVKALVGLGLFALIIEAGIPTPFVLALLFLGALALTLALSTDLVAMVTQKFILSPLKRALTLPFRSN